MAELNASGVQTIRQAVSTVREALKSINIDDRISNRYIFSLLSGYANTFIEQDNNKRQLYTQANLFRTVNCFELEEGDLNDACDILIRGCKKVMKSKVKLPKFYITNSGSFLSVSSIFGDRQYNYINPSEYQDYLNREFKSNKVGVYWIQNEYLIIPDEFTENVMLRGIFTSESEINKLNGETSSSSSSTSASGNCTGIMDQMFVAPAYLMGNILKYTIADIRNITVPLQEDAVPNNNAGERQVTIDQE
jgi:hypothetical protein